LILTVLVLGLLAVLWLGVYPAPLLEAIEASSRAILPAG
jgi:NADH:ubiquinone oxidoreductase subunit 4 (subunit M)